MNEENLKEIQKIAKIFSADKIITTTEIDQVLRGLMSIMASFRKENVQLTEENKQIFNAVMAQIEAKYGETLSELENKDSTLTEKFDKEISKIKKKFDKELQKAKDIVFELQSIEVKDGEDADEQRIIAEVLSQIKLPENKDIVLDTPQQLRDKLESLEEDEQLDVFKLKNASSLALKIDIDTVSKNVQMALSNFRIPKGGGGSGGIEVLSNGVTVGKGSALNFVGASVTNTDGHTTTITVTGGGGSIGGSITGGTEGSVLFLGAGGILAQDNANFFWDDTNNRLGIGTTTPSVPFHVSVAHSGNVATFINNTDVNGYGLLVRGGAPGGSTYALSIQNQASTDLVRVTGDGKVGIGTTSPGATLHIKPSTGSTLTNNIEFGDGNNGYLASGLSGIYLSNTSGNSLMVLQHTGNVGIGTTSPDYPLSVTGVINAQEDQSATDVSYRIAGFGVIGKTTAGNFPSTPGYTRFIGTGMVFSAKNDSTVQMTIAPTTGNVGIGTTSPGFKLDIIDTASGVSTIRINNTTTGGLAYISKGGTGIGAFGSSGAWLNNSSTDFVVASYSGQNIRFFVNGNSTESMRIDTAGNIGIGTTSPGGKLEVVATTALPVYIGYSTTANYGKLYPDASGHFNVQANGGSGKNLVLSSLSNSLTIRNNYDAGGAFAFVSPNYTSTTATSYSALFNGGSIASAAGSGSPRVVGVTYTINNSGAQSGTATGIYLNATETALNSMTHNLMDLQVGGTSKFKISGTGATNFAGDINNTSLNAYGWGTGTERMYANTSTHILTFEINSASHTIMNTTGLGVKVTPTSTLHSGGSFATGYVAKAANYTATSADYTIDCTTNTFTVTLPTAVGITGRIYVIKNTGTGVITIATTSSQTIDGVTTQSLSTQYDSMTVQSTGANWIII